MEQRRFEILFDTTVSACRELLVVKGGEYAGDKDLLANFKRGAELSGTTPLQTLLVYLSKHYNSFATYVKDQASGTERRRSEAIGGRLDDMINYCILAKALIVEEAVKAAGDAKYGGIENRRKPSPPQSFLSPGQSAMGLDDDIGV